MLAPGGERAWGQASSPPISVAGESVVAIAGQPFGVASITIPVGVVEEGRWPRVLVFDDRQRVFYQAVHLEELPPPPPVAPTSNRPIGRGGLIDRLRTTLDNVGQQIHPPSLLRIRFLFQGDQPWKVTLRGDIEQTIEILPRPFESLRHRQELEGWWQSYSAQGAHQLRSADFPPGIETYLSAMLAARLSLPATDLRSDREIRGKKTTEPEATLRLLLGTEELQANLFREWMAGPGRAKPEAKVPVPPPPAWQASTSSVSLTIRPGEAETVPAVRDGEKAAVAPSPQFEPIAAKVPPECFYLRFGRFSNSLWFQELMKGKGDGLAQMIRRRGIDYQAHLRLERILNTRSSFLAKLFGDQLIRDMAIIGLDLFVQDGPTMGILFEAANPDLLRRSLDSERQGTAQRLADQGVRLETLTIEGQEVSLLSAPDHSIRSFLIQHQNYLFVTTSEHLVRRFHETAMGAPSLATHPIFQQMRGVMPVENDYSVFAFFSPEFFQSLLSPQYQIELRRRLHAVTRLQLADMATMAARSEGKPHDSVERLMAGEYLPPWFLESVDDSQPLRQGERWIDSRRGGRGSFLPIADVRVDDCSPEEAHQYQTLAQFYAGSWPNPDPLVVGLRRFADPKNEAVEQIAVEAYVAPFGREKYGWLSVFLAPPVSMAIQHPPDDILFAQAHLSGQNLFSPQPTQDHVLFVGVKDMLPPLPDDSRRLLDVLRTLQQSPAYIGAWPLPGYLDRLPFGLGGGPPDAFGFSRLLIGAWRWQANGFSVLSFDRSILESCLLFLRPVPAEDPAQVRVQLGDLENTKVSTWVNTHWYRRALQASRGNALLLDTLQTQFRIDPEESLGVAQRLLDGHLQCPLGGKYALTPQTNSASSMEGKKELRYWTSTAWGALAGSAPGGSTASVMGLSVNPRTAIPPADYRAPWLGWFRGGRAHLTQLPNQLVLVGQLRLQKLAIESQPGSETNGNLPPLNFDLFTKPFEFFGKGKSDDTKPEAGSENRKESDRRSF